MLRTLARPVTLVDLMLAAFAVALFACASGALAAIVR